MACRGVMRRCGDSDGSFLPLGLRRPPPFCATVLHAQLIRANRPIQPSQRQQRMRTIKPRGFQPWPGGAAGIILGGARDGGRRPPGLPAGLRGAAPGENLSFRNVPLNVSSTIMHANYIRSRDQGTDNNASQSSQSSQSSQASRSSQSSQSS